MGETSVSGKSQDLPLTDFDFVRLVLETKCSILVLRFVSAYDLAKLFACPYHPKSACIKRYYYSLIIFLIEIMNFLRL